MLRRLDLTAADTAGLRGLLPRAAVDVRAALESVTPLVEAVAARGYPAVREATLRFDGVDVPEPRVPAAALSAALAGLDAAVRDALAEAIRRARIVHEAQRRDSVDVQVVPGGTVTERWVPVRRVGLYVPGGLAVYPSSVVMNVVPAQVAGRRVDRGLLTGAEGTSAGCRTRRSWPRARCSASTRCTRSAARRRSRWRHTATTHSASSRST